jgi:TPR repeat protein
MSIRLPPIGFWSYARQDDESSRGRLSSLRSLLQSELQQQYGRDPIQIFQDVSAIPPGAEWEASITGALDNTTFFIPIITPAFIQSEFCCREFTIFLAREKLLREQHPALRPHGRIFPISYLSIDDNTEAYDPVVVKELRKRQSLDFRDLRLKDYQQEAVSLELAKLAGRINQILNIRVDEPLSDEARAEEAARRRREAKAKNAAEADRLEADRLRDDADDAEAEALAARDRAAREEADRRRHADEERRRSRGGGGQGDRDEVVDKARAWLKRFWPAVAAGVAVLMVAAVLVGGGKAGRTRHELAHWGLTPQDWSVKPADALFQKGGLVGRIDELRTAADKGEPVAQTLIGYAQQAGFAGVQKNVEESHARFLAAADKGDPRAQAAMGEQVWNGRGVPTADPVEGLRWFKMSADAHNGYAQGDVAYFYEQGLGGLTKNETEAARWHALAAKQGLPYSQYTLGTYYELAKGGLTFDKTKAAALFKQAADQGFAQAQNKLGGFYARGEGGLPKDNSESLRYYRLAAENGSGKAAYALGQLYATGTGGLARDDNMALQWCRKAVASTQDQPGSEAQDCVSQMQARTSQTYYPSAFNNANPAPAAAR